MKSVLSGLALATMVAGSLQAQQIDSIARSRIPTVTLAEAIRLSAQVQPSVISAQGTVRNTDAQLRAARGQFLPSVNANSSAGNSFSEGTRTDPITGNLVSANSSNTSISMGLSARVDLFTGFRRGADIRAARAQGSAADALLVDAQYQSKLTTTTAFLNALLDAQLVTVRQAGVRRAEEQMKIAVAKLASGSATRSDSLQSLVTLGNARVQLINALAQQAQDEANLGRLIGVEGQVAAVDDSAFYRVATALDTAVIRQEALERSPRVQSAQANQNAARASLSSARSAYWPTLSLAGNYNYNGSKANDYDLFNSRSVTLSLSWPLFNNFTRERNVTQQEVSLDIAEANSSDARRQVMASLTGQLSNLQAARLRIDITSVSVSAAQEDLRVQQERYRLGASTIVEVLTSQENLSQAEVDLVNARFDYLKAKAEIEAIIGRSL
jgi:outer membrane protein TolC